MLTSYEQRLIDALKRANRETVEAMLQAAINEPKCSGPLIAALRKLLED